MLLNFGLPQKAPNIVSAPKSNVDVNSILGLSPSQYSGFQTVGDTGYFLKDSKLYQPYDVTPSYFYQSSPYGTQYWNSHYNGGFGMSQPTPLYGGFGMGGYSGGWQRGGGAEAGTIYSGKQAFRPIEKDIGLKGFNYDSEAKTYDPSMAYVYSQTPKYQGTNLQSAPPVLNLTAPTAMNFSGSSGAGRFMGGTDGLLGGMGLNFGLPSGQSANE